MAERHRHCCAVKEVAMAVAKMEVAREVVGASGRQPPVGMAEHHRHCCAVKEVAMAVAKMEVAREVVGASGKRQLVGIAMALCRRRRRRRVHPPLRPLRHRYHRLPLRPLQPLRSSWMNAGARSSRYVGRAYPHRTRRPRTAVAAEEV